MVQCEDVPDTEAPPQQDPSKRTTRILLVDDEEDLLEWLRDTLESSGFTVLVSASGTDALKRIEEFPGPIDLLLTDVRMPYMAGPELARRAKLLRPEMKVLFMSGNPDDALFSAQLEPGAQILAKPFSGKTLAHHIREILSQ
jgi:two-component system, cell cycle sensor histidine kinase and response regulator CckA